jgi:G6PDH family F420-dependent oxidoreductase
LDWQRQVQLSDTGNRFTLSVGAGERLNEHIVGRGWPAFDVRHAMLGEAIEIIRLLWSGGYHTYRGQYFVAEDARVFDLPTEAIPLAVAVSGPESASVAIAHGDELVATEPVPELVEEFRGVKGGHAHATTQIPVSFHADPAAALAVAHRQFRWSALGWKVMAELPNPVNFDAASKHVRPDDLAETIPHGPEVESYIAAVRKSADAGFDRVAFVQIGDDQSSFFEFWTKHLQPALSTET